MIATTMQVAVILHGACWSVATDALIEYNVHVEVPAVYEEHCDWCH